MGFNSAFKVLIAFNNHTKLNQVSRLSPHYTKSHRPRGLGNTVLVLPVHSLSAPSYDGSAACSKASYPHSAIRGFPCQFTISFLFRKVIQQLLTSSSLSSLDLYPSLCFSCNKVFQKAVPTPDVTSSVNIPYICCSQCISLLFHPVQYF